MSFGSKRPGFTLLEMIISVAIIAIIATFTFGAFVTSNQRTQVRTAIDQLMIDLQRQMSRAQSGQKYVGTTVKAYGLMTTPAAPTSTYTLFAENDDLTATGYGLPSSANGDSITLDSSEVMQTKPTLKDTEIYSVQYTNGLVTATAEAASIYFPVPIGTTMIQYKNLGGTFASEVQLKSVTIAVRHTKKTAIKECIKIVPRLQTINRLAYTSCP